MAFGEVQIDGPAGIPDPVAGVALHFGAAGGDIAGHQVAEAGELPFQVVVAVRLGDLGWRAAVAGDLRHPDPAVVAQDSLIRVSLDWCSPWTGMQVGWICTKQGLAKPAPCRWARQIAETLAEAALVERQ